MQVQRKQISKFPLKVYPKIRTIKHSLNPKHSSGIRFATIIVIFSSLPVHFLLFPDSSVLQLLKIKKSTSKTGISR